MKNKSCDTVFYNAKVITVDKDFSLAEAVAIGDGEILKVGKNAEVRAFADRDTRQIDLKGKPLVPGFIDTHPHVLSNGNKKATSFSLKGLHSIEAINQRIGDRAGKLKPGEWIVTSPIGEPPDFFNIPDVLREKRWPTRWDLDKVSPHTPIYMAPTFERPHPTILNSTALRLLGVTKDTPSDKEVEIAREPATGEPNGQFFGMHLWCSSPLYKQLTAMLPRPSLSERVEGLRAAIKEFNAAGVTTAYEAHGVTPGSVLPCRELWSRGELTMRFCVAFEVDKDRSMREIERWMEDLGYASGTGFGDNRLKICGATVSMDGPIQIGLALMNRPYVDHTGQKVRGRQAISTRKLYQSALLAARNNLRFNIEAAGDRAIDIALDICDKVDKEIPIRGRRWVIEHVQHPSMKNISKCKELGMAATFYSNAEYSKGAEVYVERLPGDYWERVIPTRQWLDAGVVATQSTDGKHYQPMFTLWESLKRIDGRTGKSLLTPHKKITREEALRIYTINGAWLLFWEDKLGSIEAGKLADLVVLDNDILTCPLDEIKDTNVLLTMIGGKTVFERS